MAEVGILNVGAGDTKLTFDRNNIAETIRAARIVKDMIRRGYALLVETSRDKDGRPIFERAQDFREDTCEYIIADFDPIVAAKADDHEEASKAPPAAAATAQPETPPPTRRGAGKPVRTKKVSAHGARAVAVARTAGG